MGGNISIHYNTPPPPSPPTVVDIIIHYTIPPAIIPCPLLIHPAPLTGGGERSEVLRGRKKNKFGKRKKNPSEKYIPRQQVNKNRPPFVSVIPSTPHPHLTFDHRSLPRGDTTYTSSYAPNEEPSMFSSTFPTELSTEELTLPYDLTTEEHISVPDSSPSVSPKFEPSSSL